MAAGKIRWEKIDGALSEDLFNRDGTILLESQLRDDENRRSFLLSDPVDIITCRDPGGARECLLTLDKKLEQGFAAAGFITYEAGLSLANVTDRFPRTGFPAIYLGIYDRISYTDAPLLIPRVPLHPTLVDRDSFSTDVTQTAFYDAVNTIRELIAEGEVYQVNFTIRMSVTAQAAAHIIYRHIRQSHPVSYGGFIRFGSSSLITQSPELFLKKQGNTISTRPMKGTMARAGHIHEDIQAADDLRLSEKNRAENLMIADLMRNDLGKIAVPGSVEVFDVFRVEPLNTLFQMTTGVRAQVQTDVPVSSILEATFPPGSVTGAPKLRAMQIIAELEKTPRKAYTGAVGIFMPSGDLVLNVAIRTIAVNDDGSCEMGIGSGIVYDSSPEEEWEETLLKASFLTAGREELCLLETMLLGSDSALACLEDHLDRMGRSSGTLEIPFSRENAEKALHLFLKDGSSGPAIVRVRVNRRGEFGVDISPLLPIADGGPVTAGLSTEKIDPADRLCYHKTTSRELFDREYAAGRERSLDEVIFLNLDGFITEGTFTNIFIYDGSHWKTPDVSCGLLAGIWREKFMGKKGAVESRITPGDLMTAERVVIGNSVRDEMEVDSIVDEKGAVIFRRGM